MWFGLVGDDGLCVGMTWIVGNDDDDGNGDGDGDGDDKSRQRTREEERGRTTYVDQSTAGNESKLLRAAEDGDG